MNRSTKKAKKASAGEAVAPSDVGSVSLPQTPKRPAPKASKKTTPILSWVVPVLLASGGAAAMVKWWPNFVATVALCESLTVTIKPGLFRFGVLDFFGAVVTCHGYRATAALPRHTLEAVVACTLIRFGGTLLAHVFVLGQAPSWIASPTALPSLCLAFWLTFFCPGDLWHRLVTVVGPFRFAVTAAAWVSTTHAITSWGLEKALHADHVRASTSLLCAVLCGTISGCGGDILGDLLGLSDPDMGFRRTPRALRTPTFGLKRAFLAATLYYFLTDPHGYLGPAADAAWALAAELTANATTGLATAAAAAADAAGQLEKLAAAAEWLAVGRVWLAESGAAALEQASSSWRELTGAESGAAADGADGADAATDGAGGWGVIGMWKDDGASARAAVGVFIYVVSTLAYFKPQVNMLSLAFLPLRLVGVAPAVKPPKKTPSPSGAAPAPIATTPNPKGRKAD